MSYQHWQIPRRILAQTLAAFRSGRHEVFVLWTGPLNDTTETCRIQRCVVPAQHPGTTPTGVFVHIAGTELSRIQFDNYDQGQRSVVQLHTHPGADVRMSQLDRQWEVVNHVGALSIIVPFYGAHGLDGFPGVNVYEREVADWRLWTRGELARRLEVI